MKLNIMASSNLPRYVWS